MPPLPGGPLSGAVLWPFLSVLGFLEPHPVPWAPSHSSMPLPKPGPEMGPTIAWVWIPFGNLIP